jgi:probable rRNA maturation factor
MGIETLVEEPRWQPHNLPDLAKTALSGALRHLKIPIDRHEVVVLACDDTRIAALNAQFRGTPSATNVLSWPHEDLSADRDGDHPWPPTADELGNIAIAFDTCQREAAEMCRPFAAHVSHLLIHGLLHLLGYDHIRDADATLMEQTEREILGNLGWPDPYWVEQG